MRVLGHLEARVMDVVWSDAAPVAVRQVHHALQSTHPVAYTTVLTVMDNLHGKGQLQRRKHGRAWQYTTTRSYAQHTAALLQEILGDGADREEVLMHFVADLDPDTVTKLSAAVQAARPAGAES